MSAKGKKWLHLIIRLSSLIFRTKQKLKFAHALHAVGIGIYVLGLELLLLLVSLPAYLFIAPQDLGATEDQIVAYKLRRKITLSVIVGSFMLWAVQLSIVALTNYYFAPAGSVSAATIGWHFNDPDNYVYDKSKVSIMDGVAVLKKVEKQEELQPEPELEILEEPEEKELTAKEKKELEKAQKQEEKAAAKEEKQNQKEQDEEKSEAESEESVDAEVEEIAATPENAPTPDNTPAPEEKQIVSKLTPAQPEICRATIHPVNPVKVENLEKWLNFSAVAQAKEGQVSFQISSDGKKWYFWDQGSWQAAKGESDSEFNPVNVIDENISNFPAAESIFFKALLQSDCTTSVELLDITLQYEVKKTENTCRTVRHLLTTTTCNEVGEYDEATETCTLKADITFCTEGITEGGVYIDAIGTTKNHLTLDCAGFQIKGENTAGAGISGETNMTIQNCRISGFDTGVHVTAADDVTGSKILSSTIVDNNTGLLFDGGRGGNNTVVKFNTISSKEADLVMKNAASNNQIFYNNFASKIDTNSNQRGRNNTFDDLVCAGNYYAGDQNKDDNYPISVSWPTNTDQNLNGIADCGEGAAHKELLKWYFDDEGKRAKDSSSNGHDGAIKGAQYIDGLIGKGLAFDGDNDEVKLSSHQDFNVTDQISFSVWAQTQDHRTAKIIQKGDWDGHGIGLDQHKGWQAHFRINDETKTVNWGEGQPELNKWYHLIASYNGQKIDLYVNGQLTGSIEATGPLSTNKRALMVGSGGDKSKFFQGLIDEVLVLHNGVTADDVKKHTEYVDLVAQGCIDRTGVETGECKVEAEKPEAPKEEIDPGVAVWKFNEKSGDKVAASSGENTGQIQGAVWESGVEGSALKFDGDNDYVAIPRTVDLDITEKITLQAWVKPERSATETKQSGYIISKLDTKAKAGYSLIQETKSKKDRISFLVANGKSTKRLRSKSELQVGEWTHVIGTYDGQQMRLYINGQLDSKTSYKGGLIASAGDVYFGVTAPEAQSSFQGLIDEVVISPAVTTDEQAQSKFAAYPKPPVEAPKEEEEPEEPEAEIKPEVGGPPIGVITAQDQPAQVNGIDGVQNYDLWLVEAARGNESPARLTILLPSAFKTIAEVENAITIPNSKTIFFSGDAAQTNSPGPVFIANGPEKNYTFSGDPITGSKVGAINLTDKVTKSPALTFTNGVYQSTYIAYNHNDEDFNWAILDEKFLPDTLVFLGAFSSSTEVNKELPVVNWSFDEDTQKLATDKSGNNYHGTITGAPTFTTGVSGKALLLDGQDDTITTDHAAISGYPFTFSVWYKTDTPKSEHPLVNISDNSVKNKYFGLHLSNANKAKVVMSARNTSNRTKASKTAINDGKWHHIAAVYKSETERLLYIDGLLEATDTRSVKFPETLNQLQTGTWGQIRNNRFAQGTIDELIIYDREFTATELKNYYNQTVPQDPSEPVPQVPVCGNGEIEAGEQCDAGENNGNTKACLANCATAVCGDNYLYEGFEQCDDGNLEDGDGCSNTCNIEPKETCEDNILNQDELGIDCGGVCGSCPPLLGIAPTDDTYLYSQKPDHNYGASESMLINNQGRGLIRFDLSSLPENAVIKSAKFSLYSTADRKGVNQINIHEILPANKDWQEGTKIGAPAISNEPTWSHRDFLTQTNWAGRNGANRSNTDFKQQATASIKETISANQRYEFTLPTELIQGWFDAPETNHGFIIRSSGQPAYFATKENTNPQSHPRLVVEYDIVVPETCNDNIKNQDEEEIDCGGVCGACPEPEPEPETPKCYSENITLREGGETTPEDISELGITYTGNNTYEFTKDVELCSQVHLALRSNVTLDGKGKTLKGIDHTEGRGIFLNGVSHTTVRNLTIDGFHRNYQVWQSSENLIENSTLQNAVYAAIEIRGENTRDNTIIRNTFKDNNNESGWTGFGIVGEATDTKIYYNNFLNNRKENIKLNAESQFDDQTCAGNYFDDDNGSPDPNTRRLQSPWPAADANSNGIADCVEEQQPQQKLVSHWSFSENSGCNTTDANGVNNGALAPNCAENAPKWNKSALLFDGQDDYINVGNNESLMSDTFTIATWINIEALPTNTWAGIFGKGDWTTNSGYEMYVRADQKTTSTEPHKIAWALAKTRAFSKEIPATKKWIHVAGTYDGENITLYVDGQLQQVKAAKLTKNDLPLLIGRRTSSPQHTFHGQIDELSYYNYALTASEVAQLHKTTDHNGTTEVAQPPVGPVCGNSIIEEGEQCDDGNRVDDDQCSNACLVNQTIPEGEHLITNTDSDLKVTNFYYSDIETTPRELFIEKDLKRIAYLEINDDLDLTDIIIGNDYRKGKSWVHIPQNTDRSNLDSITLLVPRQPHHVSVRICPGATNAEEVFPGCINEIILDPVNVTSANGYTLTDLDDQNYWHIQSESVDLFSTGGEGNGDTIVAQWKFDEGTGCAAADSIGSATGTLGPSCSANSPLWVDGKKSKALDFDGNDDYVALNYSYNTLGEITAMTTCGWVKVPSGQGGWSILDFDRSDYFNLSVGDNGATDNFVHFDTAASNGSIHDFNGSVNVRDNQWHFICGVYDGTNKHIYVDGVLDSTASNPHGGLNLGTGNTRYGFIGDGSEATTFNGSRNNLYFQGQIDDVSLYNFALSANEISSLYGQPSCSVVISDNFEDNDETDWVHTFDAGSDWAIENTGSDLVYSHSSASYSQVQAPPVGRDDYIITADMFINTYAAHGILFRHTDDDNYWRLVFEGGQVKISGEVGGVATDASGMTPVSFTPSTGVEYHLKVQANGNELRGKWWADGDTEPTNWLISASDGSLAGGNVGFINQESAYYDDLTVSDCLNEPSISITAPNGGEKLFFDASEDITWTSFDTSGNVKIEYSKDNFAGDINTIIASTPDTGTYSWTIPSDASKTVRIRISDVSNTSLNDTSDADFEIADPDAPFVYWAFNEGSGCAAIDAQTNVDGTLNPTCPANAPIWTNGISGSALDFDGIDDSVESDSLIIDPSVTTSFSASAWLNADTFAHLDANNDTTRIFQQYDGTGIGRGWLYIIRLDATTYRLQSFFGGATLDTTTNWNDLTGEWHHVALTYDGVTLKLFIDGVEEGSEARVAEASTGNMIVGRHKLPSGTTEEWDGKIDEVRFYHKALSPSEVTALFNATNYINVTTPNGAETFTVNTTENITWTSVNTSGNVKIEYSSDDFLSDINEIVASTPDDGQYEWTVPTDGSTTVKVRVSDAADSGVNDTSDAYFTISDPAQPILWWKFDDNTGCTAADAIADNDGALGPSCPGDAPTWTAESALNNALNFDGSGDNVTDDDGESLINGLDAVTVSMWLKSDVTNSDKGTLIGGDPSGSDNKIGFRYDASGANGGCTNCMKIGLTTTGGDQQLESSDNTQTTDWQHIAFTWSSGNQIKLYINGQLDTPSSNSAGVAGTISTVDKIIVGKGGKDSGGSAGWDGIIDEFRLYNNERSAGEISALYDSYQALTVTAPNGGESYGVGTTQDITWNSFATSGNVKIEYSKDNFSADINEIVASTADDGTYEWTIPDDVSSTVKVRVSDVATAALNDISDNDFEIAAIGGNLVSEWKLDENTDCIAFDTADSNPGTLGPSCVGNEPTWITNGVQNSALDFDGTDDEISVAANANINSPSKVSISAWVKPPATGSFRPVLDKRDANTDGFNLMIDDSSKAFMRINGQTHSSLATIADDQWHHIVAVYDGADIRLYVDGDFDSSTNIGAEAIDTSGNLFIGKDFTNSLFYDGLIDEIRLYDRDLSGLEVTNLFNLYQGTKVTAPNGGETYNVGTAQNITWNSFGGSGNVKIEYSKDNFSSDINEITASVADTGTYQWIIPDDASATVRVRVTDTVNGALADTSDASFTIVKPVANLISNWPLDENTDCTAGDAIGSNDGTLSPTCPGNAPAWSTGQVNSALDFDGVDDYVTIPDAASLDITDTLSITAWINGDTYVNGDKLVHKNQAYELRQVGNNRVRFQIWKDGGGAASVTAPTNTFTPGQWHFVAGTYNGSELKLYVDGSEVASNSNQIFDIRQSNHPLTFGSNRNGTNNFSAGLIDEVGLWDEALTAAEINSLYLTGLNATPSITIDSVAQQTDDRFVNIGYTITDANAENITLATFEYSLTGAFAGEQATMTAAVGDGAHEGTTGLSSSASGEVHTFVWNAENDLGAVHESTVYIRLRPQDALVSGDYVNFGPFAVDTKAPASITDFSGIISTEDSITFSWMPITDELNFDHYEIWVSPSQNEVQNRFGSAIEWDQANDASLATKGTSSTIVTGLTSSTTYFAKIFAIDTFGFETTVADVSFSTQAPATTGGGGGGGSATTTTTSSSGGGSSSSSIGSIGQVTTYYKTDPEAPVLDQPVSPRSDGTVPLTGIARDGSTIEIYVDGQKLDTTLSTGDDTEFEGEIKLPEGRHTIEVIAIENGRRSERSVSREVLVDTTAPAAPVLDEFSGPVADTLVAITGTAEPSAFIALYVNGQKVYESFTQADSKGNCYGVANLPAGTHKLYTIAVDAAGNTSPPSNEVTVTVAPKSEITPLIIEERTPGPAPAALPVARTAFGTAASSTPLADGTPPPSASDQSPIGTPEDVTITGPTILAPDVKAQLDELFSVAEPGVIEVINLSKNSDVVPTPRITLINQQLLGNKIVFEGGGIPGSRIAIFIHSPQAVVYAAEVDETGNWQVSHSQDQLPLGPGDHSVYAITFDESSLIKSRPSKVTHFSIRPNYIKPVTNTIGLSTVALTFFIIIIGLVSWKTKNNEI